MSRRDIRGSWSWRAAERPGSNTNPTQDRTGLLSTHHASWAYVIDGGTTYAGLRPDGGDYAAALADRLRAAIHDSPNETLAGLLRRGIAGTCHDLSLPQPAAPSAAVALAKVTGDQAELLLLGGVTAVHRDQRGELHHLIDDRFDTVSQELRRAYRHRLRTGHGYDNTHTELLRRMQEIERTHRNTPGGYWIAADQTDAADHAHTYTLSAPTALALASGGAAVGPDTYRVPAGWHAVFDTARNLGSILGAIHRAETHDAHGQRWPRAKIHDDKAIIVGIRISG